MCLLYHVSVLGIQEPFPVPQRPRTLLKKGEFCIIFSVLEVYMMLFPTLFDLPYQQTLHGTNLISDAQAAQKNLVFYELCVQGALIHFQIQTGLSSHSHVGQRRVRKTATLLIPIEHGESVIRVKLLIVYFIF